MDVEVDCLWFMGIVCSLLLELWNPKQIKRGAKKNPHCVHDLDSEKWKEYAKSSWTKLVVFHQRKGITLMGIASKISDGCKSGWGI